MLHLVGYTYTLTMHGPMTIKNEFCVPLRSFLLLQMFWCKIHKLLFRFRKCSCTKSQKYLKIIYG
jgi:hypothetical protein